MCYAFGRMSLAQSLSSLVPAASWLMAMHWRALLGELFTPVFHLELLGYSSLWRWLLNELHWQGLSNEEGWWLGSQPRIKWCRGNEWSLARNSQLFSNMTGRQFKKKDGAELLKLQNGEILCSFVLSPYRGYFLEIYFRSRKHAIYNWNIMTLLKAIFCLKYICPH